MNNMEQGTKSKEQRIFSFEEQLCASAQRLREQSEINLSTPEPMAIPQKHSRYWGWVATPAAATIGLLIGLFIQRPAEHTDNQDISVTVAVDNSGYSIADDGADYSLLVSL